MSGPRCPECHTHEVGENVLVLEIRAMERHRVGEVLTREVHGYHSPRYCCSAGHDFDEPLWTEAKP